MKQFEFMGLLADLIMSCFPFATVFLFVTVFSRSTRSARCHYFGTCTSEKLAGARTNLRTNFDYAVNGRK